MAAAPPGAPPALFALSTERDEDGGGGAGYRLTRTGRCVHQRAYVVNCAQAAGFVLRRATAQNIRVNAGVPVEGDLFVLERVGA